MRQDECSFLERVVRVRGFPRLHRSLRRARHLILPPEGAPAGAEPTTTKSREGTSNLRASSHSEKTRPAGRSALRSRSQGVPRFLERVVRVRGGKRSCARRWCASEGTSGTLSSLQRAAYEIARGGTCSHSGRREPASARVCRAARAASSVPILEGIHEDRRRLRALRGGVRRWRRGVEESRGEGVALETQRRAAARDTDSHDRLMPRSNAHLAHRVVPGRLLAACVVGMSVSGVAAARLGPSGAHALAPPLGDERTSSESAELEHNSRSSAAYSKSPRRASSISSASRLAVRRSTRDKRPARHERHLSPRTLDVPMAFSPCSDQERFFSPTRPWNWTCANLRRQRDARFRLFPSHEASASYDPLCEFVNPLLDDEHKLDCGGDARA